jgi:hypothetical protein
MEPEELRKLRVAHSLTPRELAEMLEPRRSCAGKAPKVAPITLKLAPSTDGAYCVNSPPSVAARRSASWIAIACRSTKGFAAQPFVPALAR